MHAITGEKTFHVLSVSQKRPVTQRENIMYIQASLENILVDVKKVKSAYEPSGPLSSSVPIYTPGWRGAQ